MGIFGMLFDMNGDGKMDPWERALEFMLLDDLIGDDDDDDDDNNDDDD